MPSVSEAAVLDALKAVTDPDLGRDIVGLGFVKGLAINEGRVSFRLMTPACPVKDEMRDQAQAVVSALDGVSSVAVEMTASVRSAVAPQAGRAPMPGVRNVIAIGAGKGGVGKTTVAVNVAVALARYGGRVGLIDGDVYGPNIPIMLGLKAQLESAGKKIVPAEKYGIRCVSMGFLTTDDAPIIWRGPMLHGVVKQFFQDVLWDELDYLVIDMPPGTGDVALSLSQTVPVSGSIVVTTPQTVALADSRRAVAMYKKLEIPTLGVIENMSLFTCHIATTRATSLEKVAVSAWRRSSACPFLGRFRSTSPSVLAATPGRRSSSPHPTRRRREPSSTLPSAPRRRSPLPASTLRPLQRQRPSCCF